MFGMDGAVARSHAGEDACGNERIEWSAGAWSVTRWRSPSPPTSHHSSTGAGIFVRESAERWIKAGVEWADGVLGVGAVVTDGLSDWSVGAVPEWSGRQVRVRVSRLRDALVVRAGIEGEALRLVRVAPFPADARASAGPFVCAPTRAGLEVVFLEWVRTAADASLH